MQSTPFRIGIVTPAPAGSRRGNRVTAERWAEVLAELGHEVAVTEALPAALPELLVALHARRSADAVERFAASRPRNPLVLALTGTDLYDDIHTSPRARAALDLATRLIVLQPAGRDELPPSLRARTRVIPQSVRLPANLAGGGTSRPAGSATGNLAEGSFPVCVLAHLREVKDPLRAAQAAELLPTDSRVEIHHAGEILETALGEEARRRCEPPSRYHYHGQLDGDDALRLLARCRALVISSKLEGGANAVSEALTLGIPVLASDIPGSTGLLGTDYPGLFPVGDTVALARLLHRIETDAAWRDELAERCRRGARRVSRAAEVDAWRALLNELTVPLEDREGPPREEQDS